MLYDTCILSTYESVAGFKSGLKFCFVLFFSSSFFFFLWKIGGTQVTGQSNQKAPRPTSGTECPKGVGL